MGEHRKRIVIAGTGSGAGKTTVTLGLMAALKRRGLVVQGFKCGPDYIDPAYHAAVTGRPSRNLDTWMLPHDTMREIFLRGSRDADISVIEGVMGLYDGKEPLSNSGSTAEIARLLEAPVLLVVNVDSMARSAAAVVLGYQKLDERVRIAGVFANKCGSVGHFKLVQSAIEQECGIPVLGWMERDPRLDIPERHLGLVPAIERGELAPLFGLAADRIEAGTDLDAVLSLAASATELPWPDRSFFPVQPSNGTVPGPVIAVARDAAFNFYYPENLEMLQHYGAKLVFFSPTAGDLVPAEAHGLYIGGGFPEEFAEALAAEESVKIGIKARVEAGLPVFAECGGYMYLCRSITDRSGRSHPMVGLIPAEVKMQDKLAGFGYREATALTDNLILEKGERIRGHEFHYSTLQADDDSGYPYAYETRGIWGVGRDGYTGGSLTAGYLHVHFASNPGAAERFVKRCRVYRDDEIVAEARD